MIIYGPKNANYDIDLGPVFITDWYNRAHFDIVKEVMQPGGSTQPASDNNLINGKMNLDSSTKAAGDKCKVRAPVTQEFPNSSSRLERLTDCA